MANKLPYLPVVVFLLVSAHVPAQTLKTHIGTEKGESYEAAVPHPLPWWTRNPLRLDSSGDLMIGIAAKNGAPFSDRDYQVTEKSRVVGVVDGHRIVELITTIRNGPRVVAGGFASASDPPAKWKTLLVGVSGGYTAVYALRYDTPGLMRLGPARIYGTGANAILGTYDPDTGNGGGCYEGYWWFDPGGAHNVDFSPLRKAISAALPAGADYTPGCWAMDPQASQIRSYVFKSNDVHDKVGDVHAAYRIEHGKAYAVWVHFTPGTGQ